MIPEREQNHDTRVHDAAWADAYATNEIESIASIMETLDAESKMPDPVRAEFGRVRLAAYQSVYESRLAALRMANGTATSRDLDRQAWTDLARAVKERVTITEVLELRGITVTWHGREGHSACPFCGGTDRFVIWPGPPDRAWCRQCHASNRSTMDVVALAQSTMPGCEHFHSAVSWLADLARVSGGAR